MIRERLHESSGAILDGSGNGRVVIGPVRSGASWIIQRLVVFIDGGVSVNSGAECQVYKGDTVNLVNLIDGTTRAGQDVAELPNPIVLMGGEKILFNFTGGTAGARATAAIHGIISVG